MVKGILSGAVMQTVSKEMFTGRSGREMVNNSLAQVDRNPPLPVEDRKALHDLLRGVKEVNEQRDREGAYWWPSVLFWPAAAGAHGST